MLTEGRCQFAKDGAKPLHEDRPLQWSFEPLLRDQEAEIIACAQTAQPAATQYGCCSPA
jgi:hypothetical protein